ncbi:hypothetical protein [Paenibacillus popilliae]|uniref:hypothetical protein n=1 Tax=Paenibacillus popilliae TaxID=78057 RepID=UPI00031A14BB|nr:hypothetical protein [Paenibacillus popilliae]
MGRGGSVPSTAGRGLSVRQRRQDRFAAKVYAVAIDSARRVYYAAWDGQSRPTVLRGGASNHLYTGKLYFGACYAVDYRLNHGTSSFGEHIACDRR